MTRIDKSVERCIQMYCGYGNKDLWASGFDQGLHYYC